MTTITNPIHVLGKPLIISLKAGGEFHFLPKEAVGNYAIRGYDDEGNWLQINLGDISYVRVN